MLESINLVLCFKIFKKENLDLFSVMLHQCVRMAGAAASSTETGEHQRITSVTESSMSRRSKS